MKKEDGGYDTGKDEEEDMEEEEEEENKSKVTRVIPLTFLLLLHLNILFLLQQKMYRDI